MPNNPDPNDPCYYTSQGMSISPGAGITITGTAKFADPLAYNTCVQIRTLLEQAAIARAEAAALNWAPEDDSAAVSQSPEIIAAIAAKIAQAVRLEQQASQLGWTGGTNPITAPTLPPGTGTPPLNTDY